MNALSASWAMKRGVLKDVAGVYFTGISGPMVTSCSSAKLICSFLGSSFYGTSVPVVVVCIVSFVVALLTGQLSACHSHLYCLLDTIFFLTLACSLLFLGLAYQSAVYSPSVVGVCATSEVGFVIVAIVSVAGWVGGMMSEVLLRVCLECTRGAVWIANKVELCWIGVHLEVSFLFRPCILQITLVVL